MSKHQRGLGHLGYNIVGVGEKKFMETAVAAIAIATISWLMLGGLSKEDKPKPSPPPEQEFELVIRPKKK